MSKRIRALTTLRNGLILFGAFLIVAVIAAATEPFNTSGRWACFSGTCVVGHARAPALQFLTDGTGDAEVLFPAGAVGSADILDGSVASADILDNSVVSADFGGMTMVLPFCGQLGNAANHFIGPATGIGVDVTPGNATCDGYDAAAVGDADTLPLGIDEAYTVNGMACQITSGTDDDVVMTLYDDTAAVTAITCTITTAGGTEGCTVEAQASIAEGSLLAILADPEDDNLSAQDGYCLVFIDF